MKAGCSASTTRRRMVTIFALVCSREVTIQQQRLLRLVCYPVIANTPRSVMQRFEAQRIPATVIVTPQHTDQACPDLSQATTSPPAVLCSPCVTFDLHTLPISGCIGSREGTLCPPVVDDAMPEQSPRQEPDGVARPCTWRRARAANDAGPSLPERQCVT